MDEAGLGLLIELPLRAGWSEHGTHPHFEGENCPRRKEELGAPAQPLFLQSVNCLPLSWGIVLGDFWGC